MNFEFISDGKLKEILIRDYDELKVCISVDAVKSTLILSGSIIEAVLVDSLLSMSNENVDEISILRMTLDGLIKETNEKKLISDRSKELSTVVRSYRNLIHPGREKRTKDSFDLESSKVAFSLTKMIVTELREKFLKTSVNASDLFGNIRNGNVSIDRFEILIKRMHKVERIKLFGNIVDLELEENIFYEPFQDGQEFVRILKPYVARELLGKYLNLLLEEIQKGNRDSSLKLYSLLKEEVAGISNDREFIIQAILESLLEIMSDQHQIIEKYSRYNVFSSFDVYQGVFEKQMEELITRLIFDYDSQYYYFQAFDQIKNSMIENDFNTLLSKVKREVPSRLYDSFITEYDDGNFLPF